MKGPQVFTEEEKKAIETDYKQGLEEVIDKTETELIIVCKKIDSLADQMLISMEQYLWNNGKPCKGKMTVGENRFYTYNPNIFFNEPKQITFVTLTDPSSIIDLPAKHLHNLDVLNQLYVQFLESHTNQLRRLISTRFDDYGRLLDLLTVEEPFIQDVKRDKIVVYIPSNRKGWIHRYSIKRQAKGDKVTNESEINTGSRPDQNMRDMIMNDAIKANVYIISHPRKQIPAKLLLTCAIPHLSNIDYDLIGSTVVYNDPHITDYIITGVQIIA